MSTEPFYKILACFVYELLAACFYFTVGFFHCYMGILAISKILVIKSKVLL